MPETPRPVFRKSSYSGSITQNCVEVAAVPGFTAVRDSAHPELGHLTFPVAEWRAFLTGLKTGSL
ncbi:DUF397 domain-containing protein [Thermobifida halotolerans]|uniref:DUF397 domain-containing protein n=1 Tax=Thermobifida halotolerans TaxID=483545 RepID=A0A399G2X4_9ACTN|nr:DUF397 domain-containing protein [Thermobifida halotolerans]UOE19136.1 DUF397 domain-containing protein [Thermobifida halotolerans]